MLPDKNFILGELNKRTIKDPITKCWLWVGAKNSKGYGEIYRGKRWMVHRLSLYIFKNFKLYGKLNALHILECKNQNCWNPEHLYAGNQSDNLGDTVKSGKHKNANKTHCPKGHEYNVENTYISNNLFRTRSCRTCMRLHDLKNREKRKLKIKNE